MLFELDRVSLSRAGKPVLRELSARLPLGATHTSALNSLFPASVNGCGRDMSIGWRART